MGRLARTLATVFTATLAVTLLGGCIGWLDPDPGTGRALPASPVPTPTVWPGAFVYGACLTSKEATAFTVGAAGRTEDIDAAVVGDGPTAVVFTNMTGRDGCDWAAVARDVVARGHRAVVWSYGGARGLDQIGELVAVVGEVRRRGAARVLLVGASRGGCLAMMASTRIEPRVAGVAIVSCAGVFNRAEPIPTEPWAARVSVPLLHITAQEDPVPSVAEAHAELAVVPVQDKRLVVVPGVTTHGVDLLAATEARTALLTFVDRLLR